MQNEKLPLNESKTGIFKGINRKFLGYRFENKKGKIFAQKENKAYRTIYRDWYTTGIQKIDRNYHLINEGILTKRDFTVLFENIEGKHYIPVETTDSLYIYSNTIFTGNFFEFVNTTGLNVCLIDKYGEKVGSFVPQNNRKNIKTELKQLRLYDDEKERLILARKLEIASVSNIRANLRYYERRKDAEELGKVVKLGFQLKHTRAEILTVFTDEDNSVAIRCMGFLSINEEQFPQALLCCNGLNQRMSWVKFYVDDDLDINIEDDAIVDDVTGGKEIFELVMRMAAIADEAYPELNRAIWA